MPVRFKLVTSNTGKNRFLYIQMPVCYIFIFETESSIYWFFRLISWTGRKIDPVGVDYILQKLGFHHARTTIPKWLQRGVMDPLDKVLSVLIKKLGTALQDEKEKKGKDKEEY